MSNSSPRTRWGFGWNENGGGLFPGGNMGSDDVMGGIGMANGSYSAGDLVNCCQNRTGINRTARVEVYIRDSSSAPSAPTIGTASISGSTATITFTGVSGAAYYTAFSNTGGLSGSSTTSPITVTISNAGSYTFTVKASNASGTSLASAASNSVTYVAGLLDTLSSTAKTNAIGIYAFKLCFLSYTGPAVNVRRSSDNATSDFYVDTNGNIGTAIYGAGTSLTSWLASATGYITKWYDQSGKGNHMSQATTSSQPQIITNDSGGICVYFNSPVSGGQLSTAVYGVWPATTTTNYHIHDTTKTRTIPSGGNELISLVGSGPPRVHHPWSDGQVYFDSPDRVNTTTAITAGTKIRYNFCKSSATGKITLAVDSAVYQNNISTANSSVTCIAMSTNWACDHYVYEVSVFNTPLYGTTDQTLLNASF
jgi:hypothetical protein